MLHTLKLGIIMLEARLQGDFLLKHDGINTLIVTTEPYVDKNIWHEIYLGVLLECQTSNSSVIIGAVISDLTAPIDL